jgi:hypothetical protein
LRAGEIAAHDRQRGISPEALGSAEPQRAGEFGGGAFWRVGGVVLLHRR